MEVSEDGITGGMGYEATTMQTIYRVMLWTGMEMPLAMLSEFLSGYVCTWWRIADT